MPRRDLSRMGASEEGLLGCMPARGLTADGCMPTRGLIARGCLAHEDFWTWERLEVSLDDVRRWWWLDIDCTAWLRWPGWLVSCLQGRCQKVEKSGRALVDDVGRVISPS